MEIHRTLTLKLLPHTRIFFLKVGSAPNMGLNSWPRDQEYHMLYWASQVLPTLEFFKFSQEHTIALIYTSGPQRNSEKHKTKQKTRSHLKSIYLLLIISWI